MDSVTSSHQIRRICPTSWSDSWKNNFYLQHKKNKTCISPHNDAQYQFSAIVRLPAVIVYGIKPQIRAAHRAARVVFYYCITNSRVTALHNKVSLVKYHWYSKLDYKVQSYLSRQKGQVCHHARIKTCRNLVSVSFQFLWKKSLNRLMTNVCHIIYTTNKPSIKTS